MRAPKRQILAGLAWISVVVAIAGCASAPAPRQAISKIPNARRAHDIGVPAKIAQQQLGHASVETTLNFYTHAIPETHRRAIESLEETLFPVVSR